MRSLTHLHVPRPRLVERLAAAPASVVEAPSGYGKTTLAAELAESLGADPPLVVVEDAERLDDRATAELAERCAAAASPGRLVILGWRLPAAYAGLPRLDADDLAFTPEEVEALLREALGREPTEPESVAVYGTGQGWPLITVLITASLGRAGGAQGDRVEITSRTLAGLVEDLLSGFSADERRRLAELPALTPAGVDDAVGAGAFERLVGSGLPLTARLDGSHVFPDRVRDLLAR